MKAILQEVHNELLSGRLLEPKYNGVVFAHKDDHAGIFKLINTTLNGKLCVKHGEFTSNSGAVLRVIDEGSDITLTCNPQHHHAGCLYTTIIVSIDMLMSKEDYKHRITPESQFIGYMQSRLRTQSKLHTRMVIC